MAMSMSDLAAKFRMAAQKVDPEMERNLQTFAQVGVGLMKRAIQDYHAVDTATMLNSTTADQVGKHTYLVGPTVEYAVFVALGTSRVAARPFHIKAARDLADQASDFGMDLGV